MERFLYSSNPPPRRRTKSMKVLALGLSRSGTESLRNALLQLGFSDVWHGFDCINERGNFERWVRLARKKWKKGSRFGLYTGPSTSGDSNLTADDFDTVIGHCEAVTDLPCYMFGMDLIRAYPDAKVVLNYRSDEEAWYKSMVESFRQINFNHGWWFWVHSFFNGETWWCKSYWDEAFDRFFQGTVSGNGKWVRREYHSMLLGAVPRDQLLEWTVEDGWDPLCHFLDKPVPATEFPNGNPQKELLERIDKYASQRNFETRRNMAFVFGGLGSVIAAAVAGFKYTRHD